MSVGSSALNVGRSAPRSAVFLSYASQDAEAVSRIADALRASGVEVWFDKDELVGGDAWDAKIRGQIASCALFVPVISAATQARLEGYFRIEWKLAAQRTHAMAEEKAFLLPVVIDDTRDAEAKVPAEFRAVQWTRLPGGETPEKFCTRMKALLVGGDVAVVADPGPASARPAPSKPAPSRPWWVPAGLALGLAFVALALWRPWEKSLPAAPSAQPSSKKTEPVRLSPARQLADRASAMSLKKYNSTADDFAAAEGLLKQALALDQNDAEIWAIASLFSTAIRTRGFDDAPARREAARSYAERALKLDANSTEGLFALGRWQRDHDPDRVVAEKTFQAVLAHAPEHEGALGNLGTMYSRQGRVEEALALFERAAHNPAAVPLARYNQYLTYFGQGRFDEAERAVRASITAEPSANSVTGLAMLLLTAKGDAAAAVRALADVPAANRNEHRAVWMSAFAHLAAREPEAALTALRRLTADYVQDNWFVGPTAYWVGRAHAQAGRAEAARIAFEAGVGVIDAKLKAASGDFTLRVARGELLAWLGRTDEALREARTAAELAGGVDGSFWFFSPVRIYAALGRVDEAMPLLERFAAREGKAAQWPLTPALLRIDPLWDKLRGDARFSKLIADAEAKEAAGRPPRDWPKDAELKRAMGLLERFDTIPEDVRLAEEMVQRVLDKTPTDPEAVTAMARVQSLWLLRAWDRSTARYQKAKSLGERALQLAPDEPEALAALATHLYARGSEQERALDLARRAVELAPQEPRFHRLRDNCLWTLGLNSTEMFTDLTVERPSAALNRALASAVRTAELFPRDALARYELSRRYRDLGRWKEFERATDETLALAPVANALVWKARARVGLHGDPAGMKAMLDQVPPRVRAIERTVLSYFLYAAYTGDTREGLEALNGMTEGWMIDIDFRGPRALPTAALLELAGKNELARVQYEAALAELQRARSANPEDAHTFLIEAWIKHGLGRGDEARAALRVFNESIPRPYTISPIGTWWFQPIAANLLMGDRATAVTLVREGIANSPQGRATLRSRLTLDRRMAPFRDDPEIKGLLAEPETRK